VGACGAGLHVSRFPGFDESTCSRTWPRLIDEGMWWARHEQRSFLRGRVRRGEGPRWTDAGKVTVTGGATEGGDAKQPQDYLFRGDPSRTASRPRAVTTGVTVTGQRERSLSGAAPVGVRAGPSTCRSAVQIVGFDLGEGGDGEGAEVEADAWMRRTYDCGNPTAAYLVVPAPRGRGSRRCAAKGQPVPALGPERPPFRGASSSKGSRGKYVVARSRAPTATGTRRRRPDEVYVIGPGEAFLVGATMGDSHDGSSPRKGAGYKHTARTARLVPQAQLAGARTRLPRNRSKRDGRPSVATRVRRLAHSGEAVEVPVDGRLRAQRLRFGRAGARPRWARAKGMRGGPQFKMGIVNLEVDSAEKRTGTSSRHDRTRPS